MQLGWKITLYPGANTPKQFDGQPLGQVGVGSNSRFLVLPRDRVFNHQVIFIILEKASQVIL